MGEAAEGRPAALVRGLDWTAPERPAAALVRPKDEDMFR
jgi:coenzyme F420-0:L-glutamate ligase/coenzyme F420-1:gamma-L-glutamate ligase